jgi:hypothetical protein
MLGTFHTLSGIDLEVVFTLLQEGEEHRSQCQSSMAPTCRIFPLKFLLLEAVR